MCYFTGTKAHLIIGNYPKKTGSCYARRGICIFKPNFLRLYFTHPITWTLLPTSFLPAQLRSFTYDAYAPNFAAVAVCELVIRNSQAPEDLPIGSVDVDSVSMLAYDSSLPDCARVYTQLHSLSIESCEDSSGIQNALSNPFPKLKALRREGLFSFNMLVVFSDVSAQISHVEFAMDINFCDPLEDERLPANCTFTNFYYLLMDMEVVNPNSSYKERKPR
ncbi:hypothetical protein BX667DRAFT_64179 [Coemansia mojavensis]|nr:hypothetical protein BX667DRAFT_64179 [Coemansia mojavensis]